VGCHLLTSLASEGRVVLGRRSRRPLRVELDPRIGANEAEPEGFRHGRPAWLAVEATPARDWLRVPAMDKSLRLQRRLQAQLTFRGSLKICSGRASGRALAKAICCEARHPAGDSRRRTSSARAQRIRQGDREREGAERDVFSVSGDGEEFPVNDILNGASCSG